MSTTGRRAAVINLDGDGWHRPRVVKRPGVCGGDARINGTRLAVWGLEEYRRAGLGDEALLAAYPNLSPADLAAAWEYVAAHTDEIDQAIRQNREA